MAVNPNEAPEGYLAVAIKSGCQGCAFRGNCWRADCAPHNRKDLCHVIFVKKPDGGKATASWPYDSEGTPVEVPHG